MVTLKLLELTDQYARYQYTPEGRYEEGIIRFDRTTKEPMLEKKDGHGNSAYRGHAFKRILKYDRIGTFEKEDMVAWY